MPDVAFEEVGHVDPSCADWLSTEAIHILDTLPEILSRANAIKNELGIVGDQFHVDGVDENDLIIIATCAIEGIPLTSDEKVQNTKPDNVARYKIPSVCELPNVAVDCQSFLEYIKSTGQVFG